MARPFKGEAAVSSALAVLQAATRVTPLRQAQAVGWPLRYGLSLKQTAESLGVSPGWARRLRNPFMAGQVIASDAPPARSGRHRENFTHAQEAQLLKPFLERARRGGILVVGQIQPALEAKLRTLHGVVLGVQPAASPWLAQASPGQAPSAERSASAD